MGIKLGKDDLIVLERFCKTLPELPRVTEDGLRVKTYLVKKPGTHFIRAGVKKLDGKRIEGKKIYQFQKISTWTAFEWFRNHIEKLEVFDINTITQARELYNKKVSEAQAVLLRQANEDNIKRAAKNNDAKKTDNISSDQQSAEDASL